MTPPRRLPSDEYRSAFAGQGKRKFVLSKIHQLAPFEPDLEFFSAAVAPVFIHPEVKGADHAVRRELLVLHLYDWLEFTEWLEIGPVNRACELLRRAQFLPWLSDEMRMDALKIYSDEAGHAEMSHALVAAVIDHTGVPSLHLRPAFLETFDRIVETQEPEFEPLLELLFAAISETLITGSLKRLPKDKTVQKAVKDFAEDHATDEGRHHAYFRSVLLQVWPRLPRETRRKVGPLLPQMILTFLSPQVSAMTQMLKRFPDQFPRPYEIAQEVAGNDVIRDSINTAAVPTMRAIGTAGGFSDQETLDAFLERGLQPPRTALT